MPRAASTPPRYDELPDLCTPDDAQAFLQVGRNTIYELLKSGRIPSLKFGKLIRIPKQGLLESSATPVPLPARRRA